MEFTKPKKALGQHFFNNKNLAVAITKITLESEPDQVLEIGPGTGAFTHLLIKEKVPVVAIEKDNDKFIILRSLISDENFKIINQDVLNMNEKDIKEIIGKVENTVIFGSLPYNSSKRIVSHLLENTNVKRFYYIIQKEVADKYAIKDRTNRLYLRNAVLADAQVLFDISPHSFTPPPKVNSSFIKFTRKENPLIPISLMDKYENFINQSFINPRKKLSNNLKKFLSAQQIEENRIILDKRPEQLDLEEYVQLFLSTNI